jgi:hypothetical protein
MGNGMSVRVFQCLPRNLGGLPRDLVGYMVTWLNGYMAKWLFVLSTKQITESTVFQCLPRELGGLPRESGVKLLC